MDPDAIALFRELADRSPSEREEYYAQRQVPAAVRDEVESLLRFDAGTADPLAGYVASAAEKVLLRGTQPHGSTASTTTIGTRQPVAIGRYQVVRLLGRGGMGEVFLARDPVLDRDIAIKLIGSELDDEAARRRLVQEARAAGRLRHRNIVTIFDAGEHDGRSYIAMEYVSGETLGSLIRRRAVLPLRRRFELMEGACAGLAHAHRAGVVHLDIKPDNLMLDETGAVKVLDFGIARVLQSEALVTRHLAGTLRYMSPEQVEGRPLDRRSDVFSLGCSLFELVAYVPAHVGSTKEIITRITAGPVPSLLDVVPGVGPRLDSVIRRAMALDPSDRYDDLEDLRGELSRLRAELDPVEDVRITPVLHAASGRSPDTQRFPSSWSFRVIASIGAMAAVAVGAVALLMFGIPGLESRITGPESGIEGRTPSETRNAAIGTILTPAPPATARSEPAVPQATRANEEVWRRLALGDREGVLQLLRSPTAAGGVASDVRVASEVLEAVRASVLQARQTAGAVPGSASLEPYRSAEERLARATRLGVAGRPIEALDALWQAADLYAHSGAIEGGRQPRPAPSEVRAPAPAWPAGASGRAPEPAPPPALESPRLEVGIPPPDTTSGRRAASAIPAPPQTPSDTEAVLEMLRRYQRGYEALDVSGVLQVFPSLDRNQVEQLRRTFAGMTAYEVEVRNPRVEVQTDTANVHAVVIRRMVPQVGRPIANQVETEFRLRRNGTGWVITAVTALER